MDISFHQFHYVAIYHLSDEVEELNHLSPELIYVFGRFVIVIV